MHTLLSLFIIFVLALTASCVTRPAYESNGRQQQISTNSEIGVASFYGDGLHGRMTASGDTFDANALTATHRNLPFGTRVKVTNLENNKQTVVVINDRGPAIEERLIDLSAAAARRLDLVKDGTARVKLEWPATSGEKASDLHK